MNILLAIDGSEYTKRMLAYLAAHDELLGPDPHYGLITVVPEIPPNPRSYIAPGLLEAYYREEADKVLDPVIAFARQNNWSFEVLRRQGQAGDVIAQVAEAGHYGLVVMGSHGRSGLGGVLLGSTTQRVLAHCKVPVLIIR